MKKQKFRIFEGVKTEGTFDNGMTLELWSNEGERNEAIELMKEIEKRWNIHDELLKAIKKAIKISDLWTFDKNIAIENEDEALHSMNLEFDRLIQKATK